MSIAHNPSNHYKKGINVIEPSITTQVLFAVVPTRVGVRAPGGCRPGLREQTTALRSSGPDGPPLRAFANHTLPYARLFIGVCMFIFFDCPKPQLS